MRKIKGLGRGLDALLDAERVADDALKSVKLDELCPGKYQPRTRMDEESLQMLAESIKKQGLMQPILVRHTEQDGLEIIAGERRWRAARMAGLLEVPVLVKNVADEHALAMSLIENIQREDLNPLEEANGIQRLITEFGLTHQQAAEAVGRSRSAVSNLLRLLQLPEQVQQLLMAGNLDMGHARALLSLPEQEQGVIAQRLVDQAWSVRETEKQVARLLRGESVSEGVAKKNEMDRDVLNLLERLSERLGSQVKIQQQKKGNGKLIIEYQNLDQLDQILSGWKETEEQ
jgi:ParB family chromosome partitioning protein